MIGKVIQEKRKAAGLTQMQLAQRLGVSAPAVNRWEKDLSFPDASLLAPLARLLKTDLNQLFSFYDCLSDKERDLLVDRARTLFIEHSEEDMLEFIEEAIRQNLADGLLYKEMADMLYGIHVFNKASNPTLFLSRIAEYYERAIELLPENEAAISYELIGIYSELGDAAKANEAWSRLPDRRYDKKWVHAEMLYLLKDYETAIPEIKATVLRRIADLSAGLDLLGNAFSLGGNQSMAELAKEKAVLLRRLFELWEGFDAMSHISSAIAESNPDAEREHLSELLQLNTSSQKLSSCPLFDDVSLGGLANDDSTFADSMADLINIMKK